MAIERYPFDRLPRIPRAALGPLRAAARLARSGHGWRTGLESIATLLATDLACEVRDVDLVGPRVDKLVLPDHVCALRVELPAGVAIVDLDPSLAVALVDAALGSSPSPEAASFRPLREGELGALAYMAARFLLAAQPDGSRILGWTTAPRALAAALSACSHVGARLAVSLGGLSFGARLWLPQSGWPPEAPPVDLGRLSDLPVRVRAEIGRARLGAGEVAALSAGDIVLLDVAHASPAADGAPSGRALLRLPLSRTGRFTCTIVDRRTLRVVESTSQTEVVPMGVPNEPPTPTGDASHLAGEIPVELTVEIGRATLTVASVAGLSPGEVVVLDRAPGDLVTLAIGDRLIGHGELVVVEGQVGVRITNVAR